MLYTLDKECISHGSSRIERHFPDKPKEMEREDQNLIESETSISCCNFMVSVYEISANNSTKDTTQYICPDADPSIIHIRKCNVRYYIK